MDRGLAIFITDNGCGFDPATQPPGNGLANMQRRLQDIGGQFQVESRPGHGTAVHLRFTLPLQP